MGLQPGKPAEPRLEYRGDLSAVLVVNRNRNRNAWAALVSAEIHQPIQPTAISVDHYAVQAREVVGPPSLLIYLLSETQK